MWQISKQETSGSCEAWTDGYQLRRYDKLKNVHKWGNIGLSDLVVFLCVRLGLVHMHICIKYEGLTTYDADNDDTNDDDDTNDNT